MTPKERAAMQQALEALKDYRKYDEDKISVAMSILQEALAVSEQRTEEQAEQESKCKDHPDAPHGFCRDESITQDRYVCECEFWEPPKQADMNLNCKSVQARLATSWGYVKAEQAEQEPVAWINEDELPEFYPYDDMYQSSKIIDGVRMFPNVRVSDRSMFYALTKDHTWISVTETQFNKLRPEYRMKCYAAHVRTKDLTKTEMLTEAVEAGFMLHTGYGQGVNKMMPVSDSATLLEFARAVIAADREKNK